MSFDIKLFKADPPRFKIALCHHSHLLSLFTLPSTVSTVELCAGEVILCAPQWDHWCHCSHIQVHVTLTRGLWESSHLWRFRWCCQGCWKHHQWGHTVRPAAFNGITLMILPEKAQQPTATQRPVIYSRLKSASFWQFQRDDISHELREDKYKCL